MWNILVIEDDALARETVVDILKDDGHNVVSAENGAVGLKKFRAARPDLIVTDIIMPQKEGIETILEIRQEYPDAKILAISGGGRIGHTDFLQIAVKLGANGALAKPFSPEELLSAVRTCLQA
jgi:CheY-like chemotaxis protein